MLPIKVVLITHVVFCVDYVNELPVPIKYVSHRTSYEDGELKEHDWLESALKNDNLMLYQLKDKTKKPKFSSEFLKNQKVYKLEFTNGKSFIVPPPLSKKPLSALNYPLNVVYIADDQMIPSKTVMPNYSSVKILNNVTEDNGIKFINEIPIFDYKFADFVDANSIDENTTDFVPINPKRNKRSNQPVLQDSDNLAPSSRSSNITSPTLKNKLFNIKDQCMEFFQTSLDSLCNKSCSFFTDNLESCIKKTLPASQYLQFKNRRVWLTLICVQLFFIIFICLKLFLKAFRNKLAKENDTAMIKLIETTLSEIVSIAVALCLCKIITSWDLIEKIFERKLFSQYYESHGESQLGLITFETITVFSGRIENLLIVYCVYALLFAFCASINFKWLNKVDSYNIFDIQSSRSALEYYVALQEYKDRLSSRTLSSIDHKSIWFTEYFRDCMLLISSKLIRIPITTLLLISFLLFLLYPIKNLNEFQWIIVVLSIMGFALILLIGVTIKCSLVKKQLLPQDLVEYCTIRNQLENLSSNDNEIEYINRLVENLPRYKYNDYSEPTDKKLLRIFPSNFIYGTLNPNKQDDLFFFKRNGPSVLIRLLEFAYLIILFISAYLIDQGDANPGLWSRNHNYWPISVYSFLLLLSIIILPFCLYNLTYISSTGILLREPILSQTLIQCRSNFIRRIKYTMDTLRIATLVNQLMIGGPDLMDRLRIGSQNVEDVVLQDRQVLWENLTADSDGKLTLPILFNFFNSQGLNIPHEVCIANLMRIFGISINEVFEDEEEYNSLYDPLYNDSKDEVHQFVILRENFDVFISITADLLNEKSINENSLKIYLDNLGITENVDIKEPQLKMIFDDLKISDLWKKGHRLHFIKYLTGGKNNKVGMSRFKFIQSLVTIDVTTLATLSAAADKIKNDKFVDLSD